MTASEEKNTRRSRASGSSRWRTNDAWARCLLITRAACVIRSHALSLLSQHSPPGYITASPSRSSLIISMTAVDVPYYTFNNGVRVPGVGLGYVSTSALESTSVTFRVQMFHRLVRGRRARV
jgi:hypothetical protein